MSNKGPHVQDSFVIERRLRPIYDWLDTGNYKKAIQECDKVLKKSDYLTRVRALKALALLRLGKESESIQMLQALAATKPTEDATLQAMSMCYRELQQYDQICRLYETAVKESPQNEELHTHLFMAYVRIADYKSQKEAAMTLYKMQPKKPYYCWAIMSIILQAQRGEGANDKDKQFLLLSLAERMVDKLIQENKMEAEPVQMYIIILEALKKYEKIIEVLEGPLGAKLDGDIIYCKFPYLIKLKHWSTVSTMCRNLLETSMDRLDLWRHYLHSVSELSVLPGEDKGVDCTFEQAKDFINKIINVAPSKGFALRGPYLARLELAKKYTFPDIPSLFLEYFHKFGYKPCCVGDLRDYLSLLTTDQRLELSKSLLNAVSSNKYTVPDDEQDMQRHICAMQLARLCGAHSQLESEQAQGLVTSLINYYQHGYEKFGKNILPTEQGPADAYILLAAHLLFDEYFRSNPRTIRPLLIALIWLKKALQQSPSNFHIKLLILRLYHTLGVYSEAQSIYESLDIKHLQLDSMCHVHVAHLSTSGHFTVANQLFDSTLRFFSTNYRDSSEHLTFSYKYGSFLKLTEFMDFRERMNNSFHYTWIAVDKVFLSLSQCATVDSVFQLDMVPRDTQIAWDLMRDNSNLGVFITWDPERVAMPLEDWEQNKLIYEQDIALLKMRVAILDCINCVLQLAKDKTMAKSQLAKEICRLDQVQSEIYSKNYQEVEQRSISINLPSRLGVYQKTPYQKLVLNSFKFIATLEDNSNQHQVASEVVKESYAVFSAQVLDILQNTNGAVFSNNRNNIQFLCNFLEVTSVVVLVLVVALELTRSTKKKKQDVKLRDSVVNLVTSVKGGLGRIDSALDSYTPSVHQGLIGDIIEKFATLSIDDGDEQTLINGMLKSNETALKEIRGILKNKLKLLNVGS